MTNKKLFIIIYSILIYYIYSNPFAITEWGYTLGIINVENNNLYFENENIEVDIDKFANFSCDYYISNVLNTMNKSVIYLPFLEEPDSISVKINEIDYSIIWIDTPENIIHQILDKTTNRDLKVVDNDIIMKNKSILKLKNKIINKNVFNKSVLIKYNFKDKEKIKIKLKYTSNYFNKIYEEDDNYNICAIGYILGTAKLWKKKIKEIKITIRISNSLISDFPHKNNYEISENNEQKIFKKTFLDFDEVYLQYGLLWVFSWGYYLK